jgi:hypothetical protein
VRKRYALERSGALNPEVVGYDRAATTESKYQVEVIGLGRQDWFSEPQSCFRSAHLICGAAHFFVSLVRAGPMLRRVGYAGLVSPTVLRVKGFRFYFFSREERRARPRSTR